MEVSGKMQNLALAMLIDLIHQRTGLQFDDNHLEYLAAKLAVIIHGSRFTTLMDYYSYLKYDDPPEKEWLRLFSILAVNETYFWREYEALDVTAKWIVPQLLRKRPDQPVRIWHAACASGEEPYSLAIALEEAGTYQPGRVIIDGTDFNQRALEQAQSGLYRERSFRRMPGEIIQRYFKKQGQGEWRLSDAIVGRVNFSFLNLMDSHATSQMQNYDIIFCRNVFIYFSDFAIRQVANRLYQSLQPSGVLFIAAAESLLRMTNLFELVEIKNAFAYQKRQPIHLSEQEEE